MDRISELVKEENRTKICMLAGKLLGIPYEYGAECKNVIDIPTALDCSEMMEYLYNHFGIYLPDGSQAQFKYTVSTVNVKIGDLAFFGRGKNPGRVYHVGMVWNHDKIIEARGLQPNSSFTTGEVITRPRVNWENYKNFLGYRAHPDLI